MPPDVVLALRDAFARSDVNDFWAVWSKGAKAGLFSAYCQAGGPTTAGSSAFLEEACYVFVAGVLEAELLVAEVLAGCIELVRVMRLMPSLPLSLSIILLLLQSSSFVGVSSLLLMCLRVVGSMGSLRLGGMHCRGIGMLCVVKVRVVLFVPLIPGLGGFSLTYMALKGGSLIPWFFLMISQSKWWSVGRMLGCKSGQTGFGRFYVPGPMPGCDLILFADSDLQDFGGATSY